MIDQWVKAVTLKKALSMTKPSNHMNKNAGSTLYIKKILDLFFSLA